MSDPLNKKSREGKGREGGGRKGKGRKEGREERREGKVASKYTRIRLRHYVERERQAEEKKTTVSRSLRSETRTTPKLTTNN